MDTRKENTQAFASVTIAYDYTITYVYNYVVLGQLETLPLLVYWIGS